MELQGTGSFCHLQSSGLFDSGTIVLQGKPVAAESTGAVITFDRAWGIMNGADRGENGLLGGIQFLGRKVAGTASLQLRKDFLAGQRLLDRKSVV